jgi:hypothetical protein
MGDAIITELCEEIPKLAKRQAHLEDYQCASIWRVFR